MAVDHDRGRMEATDAIFAKFPNLRDLLRDDTDRQRLRLGLRCPKCRKLLETVVLDSDTNDGLILRTLEEWESGDFATRHPHGRARLDDDGPYPARLPPLPVRRRLHPGAAAEFVHTGAAGPRRTGHHPHVTVDPLSRRS